MLAYYIKIRQIIQGINKSTEVCLPLCLYFLFTPLYDIFNNVYIEQVCFAFPSCLCNNIHAAVILSYPTGRESELL